MLGFCRLGSRWRSCFGYFRLFSCFGLLRVCSHFGGDRDGRCQQAVRFKDFAAEFFGNVGVFNQEGAGFFLALADVGFAIGTGTDIAIESADITLMRGSLYGVVDAIAVSRATMRNIRQNLFGAFIYNSLGIPVAAGVLYPLTGLLLNPIIAGTAMAFSSVTVVSNANRLRLFRFAKDKNI